MIGCRFTTLDRPDIILDPPFRLAVGDVEDGPVEERLPLVGFAGHPFGWADFGRSLPGYLPVCLLPPRPPGERSCRRAPQASSRPRSGRRPSTRKPPRTSPDPRRRCPPARPGETPPGRRLLAGAWLFPPFRRAQRARRAG